MATIHLLADEVINKIAAGEVVERPASVIKELVENALDAKATKVTIRLEDGGKELIEVSDNGSGIRPEEAPLAVKRHATSKIAEADDLFAIGSYGFRGEALAAISSVADFRIQSRSGQEPGFYLTMNAESGPELLPWYGEQGTIVTVNQLFRHMPARRKFLKSAPHELAQILEWVRGLVLSNPQVGFEVWHNHKLQLAAEAVCTVSDELQIGEEALRARAAQLLRPEDMGALIYVFSRAPMGSFEGLISPPGLERGTAKDMYLFVNRRAVRDRGLRFAVLHGYQSHLLKGRFPIALAYLQIDPSLVDVNVHPAKTEVRFQYLKDIQELVAKSIREGLRRGQWAAAPPQQDLGETGDDSISSRALNQIFAPPPPPPRFDQGQAPQRPVPAEPPALELEPSCDFTQAMPSAPVPAKPELEYTFAPPKSTRSELPWSELSYIGGFRRGYLFFEYQDRLLVLDQHAFHERILYEELLNQVEAGGVPSQTLIIPELIELSDREAMALAPLEASCRRLGLRWELVNSQTIELRGVPAILGKRSSSDLIYRLIQRACESPLLPQAESIVGDILSTMACHAAIKAGEALDHEDLRLLIQQAEKVDFYLNCPHGRPVFKWLSLSTVESWFLR